MQGDNRIESMRKATVSIIIPIYNGERYIARCLKRVLSQTYEQIEVICVNDASEDRSEELLYQIASADNRVRIVNEDHNSGTSKARKDGVLASSGDYILFVDVDDMLSIEACEHLIEVSSETPVDVIQFGVEVLASGEVYADDIKSIESFLAPLIGRHDISQVRDNCLLKGALCHNLWGKLFRGSVCRAAFEQLSDDHLVMAEDLYAYFVILMYSQSYFGIAEKLYQYCYGLGITGKNRPPLEALKAYCSQSSVIELCNEFADSFGNGAKAYAKGIRSNLMRGFTQILSQNASLFLGALGQEAQDVLMDYWKSKDFAEMTLSIAHRNEENARIVSRKIWRFPYGQVAKGSNIILYGAGDVGADYFMQVMESGYCKIVAWVDRNFQNFRDKFYPVYPVECTRYCECDIILICIYDGNTAHAVANSLIEMGITEEKILWDYPRSIPEIWRAQEEYYSQKNSYSQWIVGEKNIWLLNTPYHGNVGDYAIALAEEKFFQAYFPDYRVQNVSSYEIDHYASELENDINRGGENDIFCITGGGYMGTLWPEEDARVHRLIEKYSPRKIIFLPQTFYYGDDAEKIRADAAFYAKYPDLVFFHRERISRDFFIENICHDTSRVLLAPDMALSLTSEYQLERRGALLCLRSDKESVLSKEEKKQIESVLCAVYSNVTSIDTVFGFEIEKAKAEGVIQHILAKFASSELVVTDRLHGMIFAYLTKTPCIVLPNISDKCRGVFEWIRSSGGVFYEADVKQVSHNIQIEKKSFKKQINFTNHFQKVSQTIKELLLKQIPTNKA